MSGVVMQQVTADITTGGSMVASGVVVTIFPTVSGGLGTWHGWFTLPAGQAVADGAPCSLTTTDGRRGKFTVSGSSVGFQGSHVSVRGDGPPP